MVESCGTVGGAAATAWAQGVHADKEGHLVCYAQGLTSQPTTEARLIAGLNGQEDTSVSAVGCPQVQSELSLFRGYCWDSGRIKAMPHAQADPAGKHFLLFPCSLNLPPSFANTQNSGQCPV